MHNQDSSQLRRCSSIRFVDQDSAIAPFILEQGSAIAVIVVAVALLCLLCGEGRLLHIQLSRASCGSYLPLTDAVQDVTRPTY